MESEEEVRVLYTRTPEVSRFPMATPDLWQSASPAVGSKVACEPAPRRVRQGSTEQVAPPSSCVGVTRLSATGRILKRVVDVVFAAGTLLLLAPVLMAIAIAIKLESPGPVFYVSERIGKHGCVFRCFKFRTMVRDAEFRQQHLMHRNERDGVLFKIANDPRITRVGRVLRKYSLDELPQFFNVLRGEMSVVGPRPPVANEVKEYSMNHMPRLAVTPGITGLWQTQGRHDPSFESYVSLDLTYIENWSLGLDLKIMAQTLGVLLSGSGT